MSSGPENRFIASIHRLLPEAVYRMKNHNPYHGGIADCWYSGNAGDLWVEYKFIQLPKRPGTVIDLCSGNHPTISALQQEWLEGRHKEGRNVGVIIGFGTQGLWLPGLLWQQPMTAEAAQQAALSKKALATQIINTTSL